MNKRTFSLLAGMILSFSLQSFAQFKPMNTRADAEEEGLLKEWAVKFYRVNAPDEHLYEDANSVYSKDKRVNFLAAEGKGDEKNSTMLVKYARGKVMPQYLILLGKSVEEGYEDLCTLCNDPECTHSKTKTGYVSGRFLVNLKDSINHYENDKVRKDIFKWNDLTRLAFVDGTIWGDSLLVIQSSALEATKDTINFRTVDERGEGEYNPALFSFRLLENDPEGDFMIESWCKSIGDREGAWIKIQNGVPVMVETTILSARDNEAEIFNIEHTADNPVSNITIESGIKIISGKESVTIRGAAGKSVQISNIAGQILLQQNLASDEASLSVPTGIAIVNVEGEQAQKVIVK